MNKNSVKRSPVEEGRGVVRYRENGVRNNHKFQVGQTVYFSSGPIGRPAAGGSYKVVKLLPSDGDDYQYRIKNAGEAFERVAKERQLDRAR